MPPQQSPSALQISPVARHPDSGWQIETPVGAYGAHSRLQQSPPHGPETGVQTVPADRQLFVPPGLGCVPHVPTSLPAAMLHVPLQHSPFDEQMSLSCTQ